MKRLSEMRGELSGAEAEVLDLLEAHEYRPMSDIDKRLVLNRVRVASRGPRQMPAVRLVAVAALFTSGTLLASWRAGWIGGNTTANEVQAPAPSGVVEQSPTGARNDAVEPLEEHGSENDPSADDLEDDDSASDDASGSAADTPAAASAGAAPRTGRSGATQPGEDPTLVVEALRALRQKGNPQRAGELLKRYRASNPSGALSEDALALSIEAAASSDPKHAARLAREYLAKYPGGRYRSTAERALRLGADQ